jgi:hypothetical protein
MYHNNYISPQKYNKFGIESAKYEIFLDLKFIYWWNIVLISKTFPTFE